jgi:hypothetical protein
MTLDYLVIDPLYNNNAINSFKGKQLKLEVIFNDAKGEDKKRIYNAIMNLLEYSSDYKNFLKDLDMAVSVF